MTELGRDMFELSLSFKDRNPEKCLTFARAAVNDNEDRALMEYWFHLGNSQLNAGRSVEDATTSFQRALESRELGAVISTTNSANLEKKIALALFSKFGPGDIESWVESVERIIPGGNSVSLFPGDTFLATWQGRMEYLKGNYSAAADFFASAQRSSAKDLPEVDSRATDFARAMALQKANRNSDLDSLIERKELDTPLPVPAIRQSIYTLAALGSLARDDIAQERANDLLMKVGILEAVHSQCILGSGDLVDKMYQDFLSAKYKLRQQMVKLVPEKMKLRDYANSELILTSRLTLPDAVNKYTSLWGDALAVALYAQNKISCLGTLDDLDETTQFSRLIQAGPTRFFTQMQALSYLKDNQIEKAEQLYDDAGLSRWEDLPQFPDYRKIFGDDFQTQAHEAITDLWDLSGLLGLRKFKEGKYSSAKRRLLLGLRPNRGAPHNMREIVETLIASMYKEGELSSLPEELQKLSRIANWVGEDQKHEMYRAMALVHLERGEVETAETYLDKVEGPLGNPSSASTKVTSGACIVGLEERLKALQQRLGHDLQRKGEAVGRLKFIKGEYQQAAKYFEESMEASQGMDSYFEISIGLAESLVLGDDHGELAKLYESITRNPSSGKRYDNTINLGAWMNHCVDQPNNNIEIVFLTSVALAYLRLGDEDAAESIVKLTGYQDMQKVGIAKNDHFLVALSKGNAMLRQEMREHNQRNARAHFENGAYAKAARNFGRDFNFPVDATNSEYLLHLSALQTSLVLQENFSEVISLHNEVSRYHGKQGGSLGGSFKNSAEATRYALPLLLSCHHLGQKKEARALRKQFYDPKVVFGPGSSDFENHLSENLLVLNDEYQRITSFKGIMGGMLT